MAAFRGFSRRAGWGDLKSEVALLRADLNSLNDELAYLLRNLGSDNMNPAELAAFLAERDCSLEQAFAEIRKEIDKTASGETLQGLGRRLLEAMEALNADMAEVTDRLDRGENALSRMNRELGAFENWTKTAVTGESFGESNSVALKAGTTPELLSVALKAGKYLVFGSMRAQSKNLAGSGLRLFTLCRGGGEQSEGEEAVYKGTAATATLTCTASFDMKNDGTLLLLANHNGSEDVLCRGASLTALSLEGSS